MQFTKYLKNFLQNGGQFVSALGDYLIKIQQWAKIHLKIHNGNKAIFIQENGFENVICKMMASGFLYNKAD